MKRATILTATIFLFVLMSGAALATQCLTAVDTAASTSKATTGTSVTITTTTTGSSCTVSSLSLVSTPSFTVNDPASGQYSGFSAGTAKSFTVTAGTTGTYTYYAHGTTSDGSVDSTAQILEFISPSDMTVTATPLSASLTHNNYVNITLDITNSQSSDITTSYALNLPSGLTRTRGDPVSSSGTTVSASSTKSLVFEIKHSTCFTGTKTITFDLGDTSGATSVTITGNSSCSSGSSSNTTTTTSSSSGTGSNVTTAGNETQRISVINPGASVVKRFTSSDAVKQIEISVKNQANNVSITVTKLSAKPASVTVVTGTLYKYFQVDDNIDDSNIQSAKIRFNVTKSWLSANSFAKENVVLQRYSGGWQKLATSVISESSAEVEYEAVTPGFSVFAITAEAPAASQPSQPAQPAQPSQPQQPSQNGTQTGAAQTQPGSAAAMDALYAVVLVIILIVLGFVYYKKVRPKAKTYSPQK